MDNQILDQENQDSRIRKCGGETMIKGHATHRFRDVLLVMALLGQILIRQTPRTRLLGVVLAAGITATNVEGSDITYSAIFGEVELFDIAGSNWLTGSPLPVNDAIVIPGATGSLPYFDASLGRLTAVIYTVSAEFFSFSGKSIIDIYPSSSEGAGASLTAKVVLDVQVLGGQNLDSGILDFGSCEMFFVDSCILPFSGSTSGELVFEEGELSLDSYIGVGKFEVDVRISGNLEQSLVGSAQHVNHGGNLEASALGFVEVTYYFETLFESPYPQPSGYSAQN